MLDADIRYRHKFRNLLQTFVLVGGMAGVLMLGGWLLAGGIGIVWALAAGAVSLWFGGRVSPAMLLRLYRAHPIRRHEFPALHDIVEALAARAGVSPAPSIWYVPSAMMNAFSIGTGRAAVIAVTDGLLRGMTRRELAAVIAHEVAHIRSADVRVMTVADTIGRLTRAMSFAGLLLLLLNLPLLATGQATVSWPFVLLLMLSPSIVALLQLALSRTREFDADLDAAALTGDPEGLAAALVKLDRRQGRAWETLLLPESRLPEPSLLRTHPPTAERVRRLLALRGASPWLPEHHDRALDATHIAPVAGPPRRRFGGFWY